MGMKTDRWTAFRILVGRIAEGFLGPDSREMGNASQRCPAVVDFGSGGGAGVTFESRGFSL